MGRRANELRQLENAIAQQDMFSYLEALKQRLKVSINQSALNSKIGSDAKLRNILDREVLMISSKRQQ